MGAELASEESDRPCVVAPVPARDVHRLTCGGTDPGVRGDVVPLTETSYSHEWFAGCARLRDNHRIWRGHVRHHAVRRTHLEDHANIYRSSGVLLPTERVAESDTLGNVDSRSDRTVRHVRRGNWVPDSHSSPRAER